KVGFDWPVGQWFKADLRPFLRAFMSRDEIAKSGLLNPEAVQGVIADHLSGRRDYSLQLWSLLTLEAWHRMYIEDAVVDGRTYRLADLRGAPRASNTAVRTDAGRPANTEPAAAPRRPHRHGANRRGPAAYR